MAASAATAKGLNGIEAGAKKLAKPKPGDVGTDGGAVLNDADVDSAVNNNLNSGLTQSQIKEIASEAAGDIKYYEKALGFDEAGANRHWIPGGKTDGGVPEAIIDLIPNTSDNVTITEIK